MAAHRILDFADVTEKKVDPAQWTKLKARLEAIIERALMVDRDTRYPNAREMLAELESYIRDERLAVSALSLGEWMQSLFDEKLAQQKQMLQEGRQLAEVLAAEAQDDASISTMGLSLSGVSQVRPKASSKTPWVLVLVLLVLAAAGGAAALTSSACFRRSTALALGKCCLVCSR